MNILHRLLTHLFLYKVANFTKAGVNLVHIFKFSFYLTHVLHRKALSKQILNGYLHVYKFIIVSSDISVYYFQELFHKVYTQNFQIESNYLKLYMHLNFKVKAEKQRELLSYYFIYGFYLLSILIFLFYAYFSFQLMFFSSLKFLFQFFDLFVFIILFRTQSWMFELAHLSSLYFNYNCSSRLKVFLSLLALNTLLLLRCKLPKPPPIQQ